MLSLTVREMQTGTPKKPFFYISPVIQTTGGMQWWEGGENQPVHTWFGSVNLEIPQASGKSLGSAVRLPGVKTSAT